MSRENSENLSLMLDVVYKLRNTLNATKNHANSLCTALCLYSILKSISITFSLDKIKKFVERSANQYLQKEHFKSSILDDSSFLIIKDCSVSLFRKENIELYSKNTIKFTPNMFNIEEKCDLPNNSDNSVNNISADRELRDFDPLGFVPSETDMSSVRSSDNYDRGIDFNDVKPEISETDYTKALGAIEDEDMNFYRNLLNVA